jgi:hypothetical protein
VRPDDSRFIPMQITMASPRKTVAPYANINENATVASIAAATPAAALWL